MSSARITSAPPTIQFSETAPRATDPTVGRRFRDGLANSAHFVLGGVEAAASLVPGASVVTAALRDAGNTGTAAVASAQAGLSSGGAPEAPATTGDASLPSIAASGADQNMQFLRMQEQLQAENRRYSALSNALKARHETAKNSINNIR